MTSLATPKSLPYHEPPIQSILLYGGFLLLLNIVHHIINHALYCGLIGQLILGILFGTPLAGWLSPSFETTIVDLGYLGLILLVYEGGLNTSLRPLLSNLALSICVALTGILLPIALSFVLLPLANATPLQAFAAGAALAATSLGTTFAILNSAGFAETRLGVVLTCAAMMDDVIGLVMIQVVAELGSEGGKLSPEAVARPVGASIGLLVVVVGGAWVVKKVLGKRRFAGGWRTRWVVQTAVLIACVAAGSYAGASPLFAAFLAGAGVSWWDSVRAEGVGEGSAESTAADGANDSGNKRTTGLEVYGMTYQPVVEHILTPFFFASIGFSIPVRDMFNGTTVWKGIVYSILMFLGKLFTAVWLLRFSFPGSAALGFIILTARTCIISLRKLGLTKPAPSCTSQPAAGNEKPPSQSPASSSPSPAQSQSQSERTESDSPNDIVSPAPAPPLSLYPASILGLAMVARGEVAFLIASVAESKGIFKSDDGSGGELYLIVMWAAMLCTIVGPVGVGWLVKRVKALENGVGQGEGSERRKREDVLGVWGVGG